MPITTITINSNSYSLVAIPGYPGPADVEIGMNDAVSVNRSPFSGVEQALLWASGDFWDATITLPSMTAAIAGPWEGFLGELRGRANVFQLVDPRRIAPLGSGQGQPVVAAGTGLNLTGTTALSTRGWRVSTSRLLLRGDRFQVGYRLYMVCEDVASDGSGNATITVWPSLRESPADGTALILAKPAGLFRLAQNRRTLQSSANRGKLTTLSLPCVEAR